MRRGIMRGFMQCFVSSACPASVYSPVLIVRPEMTLSPMKAKRVSQEFKSETAAQSTEPRVDLSEQKIMLSERYSRSRLFLRGTVEGELLG